MKAKKLRRKILKNILPSKNPNKYIKDNVLMSCIEDELGVTKIIREFEKFRISKLMMRIFYEIWISYFDGITTKQLIEKLKHTQQGSVYRALARLIKLKLVDKLDVKRDIHGITPLSLTQPGYCIFSNTHLFEEAEKIRRKAYEKKFNKKFPS